MARPDPVHTGVRCMLMRGGTSKGAFFVAEDLPADPADRDDLLLRIMGSPDPAQIDGLGGAHPLTSKVAIVRASAEPGIDVDYLFLQVAVDEPVVADAQTCGNLLAGVGPFAIERGIVAASDPETRVRIRMRNTGDLATSRFATPGGHVDYDGDETIAGVPGRAARIALDIEGGSPVLPTGHAIDLIDGVRVTLADNGMPVVLVAAADLGVAGDESPTDLEQNERLRADVERLRLAAGTLLGLGDVSAQSVPKVFLLSAPRGEGHIATRAFIPARVHTSIGVLMAASVAAAARIPGTVAAALARDPHGDETLLEHPSGVFRAEVAVTPGADGTWTASSSSVRTARKIFDGTVFARPRR